MTVLREPGSPRRRCHLGTLHRLTGQSDQGADPDRWLRPVAHHVQRDIRASVIAFGCGSSGGTGALVVLLGPMIAVSVRKAALSAVGCTETTIMNRRAVPTVLVGSLRVTVDGRIRGGGERSLQRSHTGRRRSGHGRYSATTVMKSSRPARSSGLRVYTTALWACPVAAISRSMTRARGCRPACTTRLANWA